MNLGLGLALKIIFVFICSGALSYLAIDFYNRMPHSWLSEGDSDVKDPLLNNPRLRRINSFPWVMLPWLVMSIVGTFTILSSIQLAIGALVLMSILAVISISDVRHRIIPDQLNICVAVVATGFIPFHFGWKDVIAGFIMAFLVCMVIILIGKAVGKDTIGGGDLKLLMGLGLIFGFNGIITILIITALIAGVHGVLIIFYYKGGLGERLNNLLYAASGKKRYPWHYDLEKNTGDSFINKGIPLALDISIATALYLCLWLPRLLDGSMLILSM